MKTKEKNTTKTKVQNYIQYSPTTQQLEYVRAGKITGGLRGKNADREFFKLLDTDTEIRLQP